MPHSRPSTDKKTGAGGYTHTHTNSTLATLSYLLQKGLRWRACCTVITTYPHPLLTASKLCHLSFWWLSPDGILSSSPMFGFIPLPISSHLLLARKETTVLLCHRLRARSPPPLRGFHGESGSVGMHSTGCSLSLGDNTTFSVNPPTPPLCCYGSHSPHPKTDAQDEGGRHSGGTWVNWGSSGG